MSEFETKILVSGAFSPEDLSITHGESNRQIDAETEQQIEAVWEGRVADAQKHGKLLYNGLSYRLNSYDASGSRLHLDLGIVEYKVRDGLILIPRYFTLPEPYWRKGLYSTATVRTSDRHYLMVELSGKSMNTNAIELIGGVVEAEPEIVDGAGIFRSFLNELEEEVFVTEDDITSCVLTSLMQERRGNVGLYFEVQLKTSAADLRKRYETAELENDIRSVRFFSRGEYLKTLQTHNRNKQLIARMVAL